MCCPRSALPGHLPDRALNMTSSQKTASRVVNGWRAPCKARPGKWPAWQALTDPCGPTAKNQSGAAVFHCRPLTGGQAGKRGQQSQTIFWWKWTSRPTQPGWPSTMGRSIMITSTSRSYAPCQMVRCGMKNEAPDGRSKPARTWRCDNS